MGSWRKEAVKVEDDEMRRKEQSSGKMLSVSSDVSGCLDIELSPDYCCGVVVCSSG